MKVKVDADKVQEVVKQYFWLAWQACGGPMGMGFLQDRSGVGPDQVLSNVQRAGDYQGGGLFGRKASEPYGDYVFGRMMKTGIKINGDVLEISDNQPRGDYQAWARQYRSYHDLLTAACVAAGSSMETV